MKDRYKECMKRTNLRDRKVPNMKCIHKRIKKNLKICKKIADEFYTVETIFNVQ